MILVHLLLAGALQQAAPERVVLTPETAEIRVDESVRFSVEVFDAAGDLMANPEMRWIVQNDEVASVDESPGIVTALRPGQAALFVVVEGGKVSRPDVPAGRRGILPRRAGV